MLLKPKIKLNRVTDIDLKLLNKYGIKATFNLTRIDKNEEIAGWTTGNGIPVRGYNFLNCHLF